MKRLLRLSVLAALSSALAGCRSTICPWCGHDIRDKPPPANEAAYLPAGEIRGMATSLERGELHPMAVLIVQLHDVTLSSGNAPTLVAEARVERPPKLPVPFQLPYPADTIDTSHDYLLTAKIVVESSVLFQTDTKYPVLTHDAPARVQLVLARKKQP